MTFEAPVPVLSRPSAGTSSGSTNKPAAESSAGHLRPSGRRPRPCQEDDRALFPILVWSGVEQTPWTEVSGRLKIDCHTARRWTAAAIAALADWRCDGRQEGHASDFRARSTGSTLSTDGGRRRPTANSGCASPWPSELRLEDASKSSTAHRCRYRFLPGRTAARPWPLSRAASPRVRSTNGCVAIIVRPQSERAAGSVQRALLHLIRADYALPRIAFSG